MASQQGMRYSFGDVEITGTPGGLTLTTQELMLPSIRNQVVEVRVVVCHPHRSGSSDAYKLVGLSHDLGDVQAFRGDKSIWCSWQVKGSASSSANGANDLNPLYLDPPYLVVGPQKIVFEAGVSPGANTFMRIGVYYTTRKVSADDWNDIYRRTSFNRVPGQFA